jgi:hypothetical protein
MTTAEFLRQAKALISNGRTYFSKRNDYDTVQALFDLGIEDRKEAWREIMKLKATNLMNYCESCRAEHTYRGNTNEW